MAGRVADVERARWRRANGPGRAGAILLILASAACLDLSPEGKVFACPGCPDGGDEADGGASDSGFPTCDCSLPEAFCEGTKRVAAVSARCLEDGGCDFQRQETACDGGCASGLCAGEPCRGVVCEQPPQPQCVSPTSLRVYGSPGSCDQGSCLYGFTYVSCSCASGRCQEDACAGVSCNQPPPATCLGDRLRSYTSPGTCDGKSGQCVYPPVDTPCGAGGCQGGQCLSDKCAGVSCTQPPAPTCLDATTAQVSLSPGSCDQATGTCSYQNRTESCTAGQECRQGRCETPPPACNSANCAGCCDGTSCVALTGQSNGQCGSGGASCAGCGASTPVCQQGKCVDPCAGVTCNKPPSCLDAVTVEQHSGSCDPASGGCSYSTQSISCQNGQVCSGGQCVAPTWRTRTSTSRPSGRFLHAMAYDSARQRLVLFGGNKGVSYFADTWEWDGSTWTEKTPANYPSGRYAHAMAYDSARQKVVLFGGHDGIKNLDDTWEWDGSDWTRATPASIPLARGKHAMAYDSARQKVVLFGGWNNPARFADLWEWNGSNWAKQSPAWNPSAREGHAMAYDSVLQSVVLFGGHDGSTLNDTWTWDGLGWTKRTAATPPYKRYTHAMAYDLARRQVVLFGGHDGSGYLEDTQEWYGSWTKQTPASSPSARMGHAMAYDSLRQRVVLFGGRDGPTYFDQTWEYGP